MRRVFFVALLVASLAVPGFAVANAALPFSQAVLTSGGSGTFGGVLVTNVNGTLMIRGTSVVFGKLTCSNGTCTGTIVGVSAAFTLTTVNSMPAVTSSAFPTHGAWVSAVAQWASASDNRSALAAAGFTVGDIVSGAAKIEGPLASSGRSVFPPQGGGGEHGNHGRR